MVMLLKTIILGGRKHPFAEEEKENLLINRLN